ncbi:MAG: MTH938/NDUFAF3 family protein [Planctomycetota bacterium]|jgi:hypothetical protein
MSRRKKILLLVLGALCLAVVGWFVFTPPGDFGHCSFGVTTYNGIPYSRSDIQVRSDGELRRVKKTHDLELGAVEWLLDPEPDVLIIGTGWRGAVKVEKALAETSRCTVEIMTTGEAVRRYGELKGEGKKVAIHIHSTC